MGELITFTCPDGHKAEGYLAMATDPKGSVVVLQEWWGLNEQIKSVTNRFASAGYTALAPDLFKGRVAEDAEEANHMMTGLDWVGASEQDTRGAIQYLKSKTDKKTAVMGFCMGGALTIIAGVKVPECDACVCFYGIPPKDVADPSKITVPFQAHFATKDDWCTPEAIEQLRKDMADVKSPVDIHEYEGEHGFFNETREVFNRNAAEISWERTISFLNKVL